MAFLYSLGLSDCRVLLSLAVDLSLGLSNTSLLNRGGFIPLLDRLRYEVLVPSILRSCLPALHLIPRCRMLQRSATLVVLILEEVVQRFPCI